MEKNEKRCPKSSKIKILVFGLHSTSHDQLIDPSDEHQLKWGKNEKEHPKSSKNEMFIFGLHSTSDD